MKNAAGVASIIWATGYALDFHWLKVGVFEYDGWIASSQLEYAFLDGTFCLFFGL